MGVYLMELTFVIPFGILVIGAAAIILNIFIYK